MVSPTAVEPSPKYSSARSFFCRTLPVFRSTLRSDERPFWPVVSYSWPSRKNRPCVKACGSCGYVFLTKKPYTGMAAWAAPAAATEATATTREAKIFMGLHGSGPDDPGAMHGNAERAG